MGDASDPRRPPPRGGRASWVRRLAAPPECVAERVGFEPTDEQAHHLISSQARSTGLRHLSAVRRAAGKLPEDRLLCARCEGPGPEPRARAADREELYTLARDDLLQATGTVEKILGGGRYRIVLESGQTVTAQLSGRMRRFRIRVIPGDRVQVGLSPYDPTHGFITFRLRDSNGP